MLLCGPGVSVTTRRERNKKGEVNKSDEQKLSVAADDGGQPRP